tara:strand:- start:1546 stop:2091 length:546 start_codon:yes stop_codon:yes gene_type:complete
MSFFRSLGRVFTKGAKDVGGLFKKGGQAVGSAFQKGAREVGGAITRGASTIGRGLGGLGGAEIGGAVASVFGPEAVPVGAIVGRAIGGELGARTAQEIGKATAPVRRSGPGQVELTPRNVNMLMPPVQPPILPGPKPMVGRDGGGIYRGPPLSVGQKKEMLEAKRNSLERNKPKKMEVQVV